MISSTDTAARVLIAETKGEVVHLVLNRPQKRNALSWELLGELLGCSAESYRELFTLCSRVMQQFRSLPQPVIARVQGMATAAGCQLVAACDLAVAADT